MLKTSSGLRLRYRSQAYKQPTVCEIGTRDHKTSRSPPSRADGAAPTRFPATTLSPADDATTVARRSAASEMADFAFWAAACETSIWPVGTFARAHPANGRAAVEDAIDADPLAAFVRSWPSAAPGLVAPPTSCVSAAIAVTMASRGLGPGGPKIPGRLRGAQTFLRALGIEVAFSREGRAGSRVIRIRATPETTVSTVRDHGTLRSGQPPPVRDLTSARRCSCRRSWRCTRGSNRAGPARRRPCCRPARWVGLDRELPAFFRKLGADC